MPRRTRGFSGSNAGRLVLVMWVAALASQLSLFGAEHGHPTPVDLIAMTIGALSAMFAGVARFPVRECRAA